MALFKESLKEFETGDDKPGLINIFPYTTEVLKERLKLLKHRICNLPEPMETKILNIIKIGDNHKFEHAGIKTYHNCG